MGQFISSETSHQEQESQFAKTGLPLPKTQEAKLTDKDKYLDLDAKHNRNQAQECALKRNQAYERSQRLWKDNHKADAKKYSDQGKHYEICVKEYNKKAADRIYEINNKGYKLDTLDLHGLYVTEAVEVAEKRIQDAMGQRVSKIQMIVGKGNHSEGGVQKIKPAIVELVNKYHLKFFVDPKNTGVINVEIGANQFTAPQEQSSCVIF